MIAVEAVRVSPQRQAEQDREFVSTAEICRLAGVTFRQLDHWHRRGVFGPPPDGFGSGFRRRWNPEAVPRVRLLGVISEALDKKGPGRPRGSMGASTELLTRVFRSYDDGGLFLAPGLWLRWDVESDTVED